MITDNIFVGLSTTYEKIVSPSDTFITKSVQIENLLSTPVLLATIIEISWNMLKSYIPAGYITVVSSFRSYHLAPTLVGEKVMFKMTVDNISNNRIRMTFSAFDMDGEICKGILDKVVVREDKLLEDAIKRVKL